MVQIKFVYQFKHHYIFEIGQLKVFKFISVIDLFDENLMGFTGTLIIVKTDFTFGQS